MSEKFISTIKLQGESKAEASHLHTIDILEVILHGEPMWPTV